VQAELQQQAKEFDTEASGAASLLHSIFGIKRSGTGSSQAKTEEAVVAEQQSGSQGKSAGKNGTAGAAAVPVPSTTGVDRAPAQSLLGSLFGWRSAAGSAKPTTEEVQTAAALGKPASTSPSGQGTSGSDSSETSGKFWNTTVHVLSILVQSCYAVMLLFHILFCILSKDPPLPPGRPPGPRGEGLVVREA
jgi:hypothetical protein